MWGTICSVLVSFAGYLHVDPSNGTPQSMPLQNINEIIFEHDSESMTNLVLLGTEENSEA